MKNSVQGNKASKVI